MKDLFETPELIPSEVKAVIATYSEDADLYKEAQRILNEIRPLGYEFDFGLDGVPYDLRKIKKLYSFYLFKDGIKFAEYILKTTDPDKLGAHLKKKENAEDFKYFT